MTASQFAHLNNKELSDLIDSHHESAIRMMNEDNDAEARKLERIRDEMTNELARRFWAESAA